MARGTTRRKGHQQEMGDGLAWTQFHATAEGLDPAEIRRRERLAGDLVAGRLNIRAWLSGRA